MVCLNQVRLNVGGTIFTTSRATLLQADTGSPLEILFCGSEHVNEFERQQCTDSTKHSTEHDRVGAASAASLATASKGERAAAVGADSTEHDRVGAAGAASDSSLATASKGERAAAVGADIGDVEELPHQPMNAVFLDNDPTLFKYILGYLRLKGKRKTL